MSEHTIRIEGGAAEFVYSDELEPLLREGEATVTRASHVEPTPGGGWLADMSPSGGPVIGASGQASCRFESRDGCAVCAQHGDRPVPLRHEDGRWKCPAGGGRFPYGSAFGAWSAVEPFQLREEALAAEREWLRRERGL